MSASLAYFDFYRSDRIPANLTQTQRDCFGADAYAPDGSRERLPYEMET